MQEEELNRKVAILETKVGEHDRKLDAQVEKNESLTRLTILMERQLDDSKDRERRQELRDQKQSEQMDKFSDTLINVNTNLTNLNTKQELLDERVNGIELSLNKQTFSIMDIIKYIGATCIGLIVAWVYMKFGL